mmetsp:Transcript_20653/g.20399  ORF Transcript_20653/g.20399 Transcript_20653/m.20399 type:complete len:215 (-) Transcript_20653:11-655(-)
MSKQTDTPEHSEDEGENEDDELEYYFSCHERMIHDSDFAKLHSNGSDVFKNITKEDFKENNTAPNLSRSTLQDQIDYDLVNFKINESSVESSFLNKNANNTSLNENKVTCSDVKPKLMGFLNTEKIASKIMIPSKPSERIYWKEEAKEVSFGRNESGNDPSNGDFELMKNQQCHTSLRAQFAKPETKPTIFVNEENPARHFRNRSYIPKRRGDQ